VFNIVQHLNDKRKLGFILVLAWISVTIGTGPGLESLAAGAALCPSILAEKGNPISRQIFLQLVSTLEGQTPDEMLTNKFRSQLFRTEGLAKLLTRYGGKKFEELNLIYDQSKALEDILGEVDMLNSMAAVAEKVEAPKILKDHLQNQLKEAKEKSRALLDSNGWISGKIQKKMKKAIAKLDWPKNKKMTRILAESLQEFTSENRKVIRDELIPKIKKAIDKNKFTEKILEEDLHDIRRRIRWMPILLNSLRGWLGYREQVPLSDRELSAIYAKQKDNPYNQVPTDVKSKIRISPISIYVLSEFIDEIGELKDRGERLFFMTRMLVESGAVTNPREAKALSEKWLMQTDGRPLDLSEISDELNSYLRLDPLKLIKDEIKEELEK
jgi:hypothetical protein